MREAITAEAKQIFAKNLKKAGIDRSNYKTTRDSIIEEAGRKLRYDLWEAGIDTNKCYIELSWGFNIIDKETKNVLADLGVDGTSVYKNGDVDYLNKKMRSAVHFALTGYGRRIYQAYMGKSNHCEYFSLVSRDGQTYISFDNFLFPFKESDLKGVDFVIRQSSISENNSLLYSVVE